MRVNLHAPGGGATAHESLAGAFGIPEFMPPARRRAFKVTGIIAEYNPFHSGHEYHIQKAREITNADYIVIAMSGDFVQRGGPAVFDKYTRAHMALLNGADLVLELPSSFACSTAEEFAGCGVALLDQLGVVDHLCFGSECGDVEELKKAADLIAAEPAGYSLALREQLKTGVSFPAARQIALEEACEAAAGGTFGNLISSPNNILGLEYCKAIQSQHASLNPVTILRQGAGYHESFASPSHKESGRFASASGIRQALYEEFPRGEWKDFVSFQTFSGISFLPPVIHHLFSLSKPLWPEDFSSLLNQKILDAVNLSPDDPFSDYSDFSLDLSQRLKKSALDFSGWEDRTAQLKTRQYTYTRVNRALTRLLLGIKKDTIEDIKKENYAFYARMLGFRRTAVPLLTEIKKNSRIPLISRPSAALNILSGPALNQLQQDLYASHLYQCAYEQRYHIDGRKMKNEFNRKMLVL